MDLSAVNLLWIHSVYKVVVHHMFEIEIACLLVFNTCWFFFDNYLFFFFFCIPFFFVHNLFIPSILLSTAISFLIVNCILSGHGQIVYFLVHAEVTLSMSYIYICKPNFGRLIYRNRRRCPHRKRGSLG